MSSPSRAPCSISRLYKNLNFNGLLCGNIHRYAGLQRTFNRSVGNKPQDPLESQNNAHVRLQKIIKKSKVLSKLNENPRFSRYFTKLAEAGVTSTVSSFLIIHELTAIVPLFSLWWVFYQIDLPDQYELPLYFTDLLNRCGDAMEKLIGENYSEGFDRNRLILSGAISYAIVKILYPLRVLISLWTAPYLGKWLLSPFYKITSLFKGKDKVNSVKNKNDRKLE